MRSPLCRKEDRELCRCRSKIPLDRLDRPHEGVWPKEMLAVSTVTISACQPSRRVGLCIVHQNSACACNPRAALRIHLIKPVLPKENSGNGLLSGTSWVLAHQPKSSGREHAREYGAEGAPRQFRGPSVGILQDTQIYASTRSIKYQ